MLTYIEVNNFKCFSHMSVELSNLNVLSGINSMGKSSIIQSLLLLKQSYDMDAIKNGLHLNGELTAVGTGYDILYRESQEDLFSIDIGSDNVKYCWKYRYKKDSDFQEIDVKDFDTNKLEYMIDTANLFNQNFAYVSAERIGPQRYYKESYHKIFEKNQVGYRGELFAGYLAERGFSDKVENLCLLHASSASNLLIYQTEAWLSEISPGIRLNAKKYSEAGIVSIGYGVSDNEYSPINVGFGLSYVAPIIVALLKAKAGDLVILENPEAHLHPKGQRKMGEMIAKACAGGVQVIVETHSDHILNGIRLSVKRKIIDNNAIRLNYFYPEYQNKKLIHKKCSPKILDDGSLSDWPEGFFDEWDKAIEELF